MQELSLAGNLLRELPDGLGKLSKLRKLQLSGNRLKGLPESLCSLIGLEVSCFSLITLGIRISDSQGQGTCISCTALINIMQK